MAKDARIFCIGTDDGKMSIRMSPKTDNMQQEQKDENKSDKKRAIILGIVLFVLLMGSTAAYFLLHAAPETQEETLYAGIYQDGELIERISLSELKKTYQKKIVYEDGGYNIVEIRKDSVGVIEADCPDKRCVKQGFTSNSVEPVVCLPHKLILQIEEQ